MYCLGVHSVLALLWKCRYNDFFYLIFLLLFLALVLGRSANISMCMFMGLMDTEKDYHC